MSARRTKRRRPPIEARFLFGDLGSTLELIGPNGGDRDGTGSFRLGRLREPQVSRLAACCQEFRRFLDSLEVTLAPGATSDPLPWLIWRMWSDSRQEPLFDSYRVHDAEAGVTVTFRQETILRGFFPGAPSQ